MPKQTAPVNENDELIKTIENLTFTIEMAKFELKKRYRKIPIFLLTRTVLFTQT